jgi:S-DNA-T family DNA segregation ATPase FtsK/SpoIIIE
MGKKINPLRANTFRQEAKEEEPEKPDIKKPEKPARKKKPEKPVKPKKEKKARKPIDERYLRVMGLFFLLFSLYLFLSFASYTQTWKVDFDFSSKVFSNFTLNHFLESKTPENWVGKIGALTAYLFISEWFGIASFLFVLILVVAGLKFLLKFTVLPLVRTLQYSFFGIVWTPVALSVIFPGEDILFGVYGLEMNKILQDFLGYSGLILLLGFIFLSFLILSFNIPFRWLKKKEKVEILLQEVQPEVIAEEPVSEEEKEAGPEENYAETGS